MQRPSAVNSRRNFLVKAVGAAAAARLSPFIPATALGQTGAAPKRILVIFTPMGYLEPSFWPTKSAAGWELGETMTALQPWKSKLIYPDGLLMHGADWFFPDDDNEHGSGMAMVFTGSKKVDYAEGPSFEQVIADHLYTQEKTKFRAIGLGVNAPAPTGRASCFLTSAQNPVVAQNSPQSAYTSLFSGLQPGSGIDPAVLTRLRRQKQSVIDMVRGELGRVCTRIGREEKDKCDAHLDAITKIESRLQIDQNKPMVTACSKPAMPSGTGLIERTHQQMDIIASAFTCDLTRVATLQMGFCDGGLDMLPGINHHDTTHATGDTKGGAVPLGNHKKIDRWFADRWAYLFGKLSAVQEGNGSLLDNTLVVFGSDTTTNASLNSWGAHQFWRFPYWMAGGGNFAFPTGRHIEIPRPATAGCGNIAICGKSWTSSSRLFVSILRKFGIERDKFGTMDPGTGPLALL